MKLIDKFYCIQKEVFANGSEKILSEGECEIKQELLRPDIFIDKCSLFENVKRGVSKGLSYNPQGNSKFGFTKEELIYLSNIFDFKIIERDSGYELAKISDDDKLSIVYLTWVLTNWGKEIIIIEARRWQFDYQPRSAGEDQLGEDVTYIHGIWENPEVPESIMKKIKGEI